MAGKYGIVPGIPCMYNTRYNTMYNTRYTWYYTLSTIIVTPAFRWAAI